MDTAASSNLVTLNILFSFSISIVELVFESLDDDPRKDGKFPQYTTPVHVSKGHHFRGAKGEHLNSFVRVQFADFDFKESPAAVDTASPKFDYHATFDLNVDDLLVDTFANKKVVITLVESLPKEKVAVLGTTEVSLFAFLKNYQHPSLVESAWYPVSYVNPKLLPNPAAVTQAVANAIGPNGGAAVGSQTESDSVPELNLSFALSAPILAQSDVDQGNFLSLRLDSLGPVPDDWTLKDGNEKDLTSNIFTYSVNLSIPKSATSDRLLSLTGGALVGTVGNEGASGASNNGNHTSATAEVSGANGSNAVDGTSVVGSDGGAGAIPGGLVGAVSNSNLNTTVSISSASANNTGTIASGGNNASTSAAAITANNANMKRVKWSQTVRAYLSPEAVVRLRERVTNKQPLEMEFLRELQAKFAHVVDPMIEKYRGRIYLDCSSLLFPKATSLKGRFTVESFSTSEEATDIKDAPQSQTAAGAVATKGKSAVKPPVPAKETNAENSSNVYKELGTTISLELNLERPLHDKKKLQPTEKSVSDFIRKREVPLAVQNALRGKKALDAYRNQIASIARSLAGMYRTMFAEETTNLVPEDKKKKFIYSLNKDGHYYNFKEKLKVSVVQIVREHFQKGSAFATKEEMQTVMSEVYVYLVDQMHAALNQIGNEDPVDRLYLELEQSQSDISNLLLFANEAELDMNYQLAAFYHQERIAKDETNVDAWFDYGCFCCRIGLVAKGEECFKEIIANLGQHLPSLLALGSLCAISERFDEAQTYMKMIESNKTTLVYVILGLFYELVGQDAESEKCIAAAQKSQTNGSGKSIFIEATEFALRINAGQFVERALAQEILTNSNKVQSYVFLAQLELQRRNFKGCEDYVREAISTKQDDPNAWALLGHLYFLQGNISEAESAYDTVLALPTEPANLHLVYSRAAAIHLSSSPPNIPMAKTLYLQACSLDANASSWLGVGRACLAAGELSEAEEALSEANIINHRNSEVWGYLALLSLRLGRAFQANQCIKMGLRLGINNSQLLSDIGKEYLKLDDLTAAAECFRNALSSNDTHASGIHPAGVRGALSNTERENLRELLAQVVENDRKREQARINDLEFTSWPLQVGDSQKNNPNTAASIAAGSTAVF